MGGSETIERLSDWQFQFTVECRVPLRFFRLCPFDHVHEIAGDIAVRLIFEGYVEIGRGSQHVEQAPHCEAPRAILLKSEINPHPLQPRLQGIGRNSLEVCGGEIAAELIVEVQERILFYKSVPKAVLGLLAEPQLFGVTQTSTGAMNLPGAGLPTWTRSAVTSSPVSRLNEAQGFGIRPKVIVWIGWPVAEFMMVALMLIACRYCLERHHVHASFRFLHCLAVRQSPETGR